MNLHQLLHTIDTVAQEKGISTPFICGGVPRDKIMGRLNQMKDVDLTTGDNSVFQLAKEAAQAIPGSKLLQMSDNHNQILVNKLQLDFSTNFLVPNIQSILSGAGVKSVTSMHCELYSRDFTCNALLLSLDLKKIQDPTGLGILDIQKKLLRTCLPAAMTLGSQPKRIVRIPYLAAKLGFEVDGEIIDWVRKHPESIAGAKPNQLVDKLSQAFKYNRDLTLDILDAFGCWKYIPATEPFLQFMNKPGRL